MSSRVTPILVILLVIAAFAIGSMWTKIQYLQQGTVAGAQTQNTQPSAPQPAQAAQQPAPAAPKVDIKAIKALFTSDRIAFGDASKKVLFVEISDPSCPYCHFAGGKNPELSKSSGRFQYVTDGGSYTPPVPEMKKLVDAGKAGFVWMYANGHGSGELGAQALYCAHEKGQFWAAHDLLMNNKGYDLLNNTVKNDKANSGQLATYLASAVDQTFMKTCLESGKYGQQLVTDQQAVGSLGFGGTPHFQVNETTFNGAQDYKTMEPVVKSLL
jgi:protein-disulfide isomerase